MLARAIADHDVEETPDAVDLSENIPNGVRSRADGDGDIRVVSLPAREQLPGAGVSQKLSVVGGRVSPCW